MSQKQPGSPAPNGRQPAFNDGGPGGASNPKGVPAPSARARGRSSPWRPFLSSPRVRIESVHAPQQSGSERENGRPGAPLLHSPPFAQAKHGPSLKRRPCCASLYGASVRRRRTRSRRRNAGGKLGGRSLHRVLPVQRHPCSNVRCPLSGKESPMGSRTRQCSATPNLCSATTFLCVAPASSGGEANCAGAPAH